MTDRPEHDYHGFPGRLYFPGQLRVAPWAITKNLDLGRLLSTPWDTELGFTVRYIYVI